jgi:hypothetical protein
MKLEALGELPGAGGTFELGEQREQSRPGWLREGVIGISDHWKVDHFHKFCTARL